MNKFGGGMLQPGVGEAWSHWTIIFDPQQPAAVSAKHGSFMHHFLPVLVAKAGVYAIQRGFHLFLSHPSMELAPGTGHSRPNCQQTQNNDPNKRRRTQRSDIDSPFHSSHIKANSPQIEDEDEKEDEDDHDCEEEEEEEKEEETY